MGFALLMWAAIIAYVPAYINFSQHWSALIFYIVAAIAGLIGLGGTLHEVLKLWPLRMGTLNENLAVALFLGGLAWLAHYLGTAIAWVLFAGLLKIVAVILLMLAALGFAFSTEDAIQATLTHRSASTRRRVWNAFKAASAFVVGLLSAAAAAMEIIRAFR